MTRSTCPQMETNKAVKHGKLRWEDKVSGQVRKGGLQMSQTSLPLTNWCYQRRGCEEVKDTLERKHHGWPTWQTCETCRHPANRETRKVPYLIYKRQAQLLLMGFGFFFLFSRRIFCSLGRLFVPTLRFSVSEKLSRSPPLARSRRTVGPSRASTGTPPVVTTPVRKS